jgi:hypothetical protein
MKPRIFIGSSTEGLALAEAVQRSLEYVAHCTIWSQAVFTVGAVTIDALLSAVSKNDFAILICSPDDITKSRSNDFVIPRDNVLLEAGMFLGRYGADRSFLVVPRDIPNFHMPTDLLGVTLADYESKRLVNDTPDATLGTACSKIKYAIQKVPNHLKDLEFVVSHNMGPAHINYPSKISVDIYNKSQCNVVLRADYFRYGKRLRFAANANSVGHSSGGRFWLGFRGQSGMHTLSSVLLAKGDSTNCYVPVDPTESSGDVQNAIKEKEIADLHITCFWMDDYPRLQYHVETI